MILRLLIRKALCLAAAETARGYANRWLKGEISIQDLWDRAWRGSPPREANEKSDLGPPADLPSSD